MSMAFTTLAERCASYRRRPCTMPRSSTSAKATRPARRWAYRSAEATRRAQGWRARVWVSWPAGAAPAGPAASATAAATAAPLPAVPDRRTGPHAATQGSLAPVDQAHERLNRVDAIVAYALQADAAALRRPHVGAGAAAADPEVDACDQRPVAAAPLRTPRARRAAAEGAALAVPPPLGVGAERRREAR